MILQKIVKCETKISMKTTVVNNRIDSHQGKKFSGSGIFWQIESQMSGNLVMTIINFRWFQFTCPESGSKSCIHTFLEDLESCTLFDLHIY